MPVGLNQVGGNRAGRNVEVRGAARIGRRQVDIREYSSLDVKRARSIA